MNRIKEMRSKMNLTQSDFGKTCFNIPLRTIQNWETNKSKCPEYVVELIEFFLKNSKKI